MSHLQRFMTARDSVGTHVVAKLNQVGDQPEAAIAYYVLDAPGSSRPNIVMFASAGREVSDFNELAVRVNQSGYPVMLVEAPGIGASVATKATPSLFDLAKDAHQIYAENGPVVFLGHAFGNRVARASATLYPEHAAGLILIASGGQKPIPERARRALNQSFDGDLSEDQHAAAVRYAFFADGNEIPDYWLRGWHAATARLQGHATASTSAEAWTAGGRAPMLVIAGLQDTIAPPADTIDYLELTHPDRVQGVRLDGAGHALLPEKPDEISRAILDWLDQLPTIEGSKV
ncbi:MAG: alpha/beta hydrolase [Pseudomonadota bacterium]